jgi:hypothetical protein
MEMTDEQKRILNEWRVNAATWVTKMTEKYGLLGCTIKRTYSGEVLLSLYFVDGVSYSGTMDKACAINHCINEEEPISGTSFCNLDDKENIKYLRKVYNALITPDNHQSIFKNKSTLKTYLTHLMGLTNAMLQILYINEHNEK